MAEPLNRETVTTHLAQIDAEIDRTEHLAGWLRDRSDEADREAWQARVSRRALLVALTKQHPDETAWLATMAQEDD